MPDEKLMEIQDLLKDLLAAQYTTVGEFESFLGKLTFTSQVVVPGWTFMRHLWDTLKRAGKSYYRLKLTENCRQDLLWWQILLKHWNGKSFFLNSTWTEDTDIGLYTDAGNSGWGAYYGTENRWAVGTWTPKNRSSALSTRNCLLRSQHAEHGGTCGLSCEFAFIAITSPWWTA